MSPTRVTTSTAPPAWHVFSADVVAERLDVDPGSGLSTDAARRRAAVYGLNEIQEQRRRSPWRMLLDQFTDFMILVLIAAAIVSGLIGDPPDAITIVVIVVLNGVIGFMQEYRAERAVAALRGLVAPTATVRRDRQVQTVPATHLTPGDIVQLEAGNLVPADLRLVEVARCTVDEAALTGESVPVNKFSSALHDAHLPLGDRLNMAYKGTHVTAGRATGIVVATGAATELGRIAALLVGGEARKTPLQLRLAQFGRHIAIAVLAICTMVFVFGLRRGEPPALMFLTAVSLAVAAIPEALPAVVTVLLALGARRMVKQQALIRRLPAVETLGSVTYICADKTGTLTRGEMRVEQIDARDDDERPLLYRALALNNDATCNARSEVVGDPTEVALHTAAAQAGYSKAEIERTCPRIAEIPFDAERQCMTTFHRTAEGVVAFTKGAPERVLPQCDGTGAGALQRIADRAEQMAAGGLRVLAIAYRVWPALPADLSPDSVETGLSFLGLVGLADPPRGEARDAVALCRSAGITPVMITGDHPATARAISARLGIIDDNDAVITGQELAQLSPEDLAARVGHIRAYARVAPAQKVSIVEALQRRGEFVAMTGDGVNDAPALTRADIGVAMGMKGTDVAREAAHMILLDDNFATIVAAVREGRRIFDNTRKFIRYAVTCNSGEIWTIFLAPFFGLPIPLLPIHILWINLVTDGLPGVALAAEPAEPGIMRRGPRPPQESLFAHGMWQHIVWVGLLMAGVSLVTQAWGIHTQAAHWQTMVFTVLALSQMGHALAIRSERVSLFQQGIWSNRPLLGAVALTCLLQLATIYVPSARLIFKTAALSASELTLCLVLSAVVFVAVEIEKWMIRCGRLYPTLRKAAVRRAEIPPAQKPPFTPLHG